MTTPSRTTTRRLLAGATAAAAWAALAVPAAAAAPTDLQPEDLSRGPDVAVAHIEGRTFVDGARRVPLGRGRSFLVGRSGRSWIIGRSALNNTHRRVVRLRPDDSMRVIDRGTDFYQLQLSEDGRFLLGPAYTARGTTVRVRSARTGAVRASRVFRDHSEPLGMAGQRVLLSSWERGVSWWDLRTGSRTRLTPRAANTADLGNDLLATYTKDPYRGGCLELTRLSDLSTLLWRSCTQRIDAFSPDGLRMATIDLLSDGIGPGAVWEREVDGTLLGAYTTGWFGAVRFEDDQDLLLDVNGDTLASTVRCREGACENATDPVPVRPLRQAPPFRTSAWRTWRSR